MRRGLPERNTRRHHRCERGDIIGGTLDIVRSGEGPDVSRKWASACMLSGECVEACDYGVNPRFLLAMARVAITKASNELPERRRQGIAKFREVSRDVSMFSRLQLDDEMLERLGQKAASAAIPAETPDFVFYTGCNVLKTPHIALLALDIMDALGITYQVMGGPTHCCGVSQLRTGDVEMSGRMGSNTIEKMSHAKSGQVISWCPSCYVQFTETTIPAIERQGGARPFEMTPFLRFLRERLAQLTPLLQHRRKMRVALHSHPGVAGVTEAAVEILQAIPGVELVDLKQPAVGLQSVASACSRRTSASCSGMSCRRRRRLESTRWSRSIIRIIASSVRTNAIGRFASSTFLRWSARAWGCTATTATSSSN